MSGKGPLSPAKQAARPNGAFDRLPMGRALVASSVTDGAQSRTRGQGFRRQRLARRSWSPYHNDGPQMVQSQGRTSPIYVEVVNEASINQVSNQVPPRPILWFAGDLS